MAVGRDHKTVANYIREREEAGGSFEEDMQTFVHAPYRCTWKKPACFLDPLDSQKIQIDWYEGESPFFQQDNSGISAQTKW